MILKKDRLHMTKIQTSHGITCYLLCLCKLLKLQFYIYVSLFFFFLKKNSILSVCSGFGFVTYKTVEAAKKALDDPERTLGVGDLQAFFSLLY